MLKKYINLKHHITCDFNYLATLLPDPIHAIFRNESFERTEHSSLTLVCAFFKDPDDPDPFPQVNWTGPSYSSVETATQLSNDLYESKITFAVSRAHYGNFTCSVDDVGVGVISRIISLKVYCKFTVCIFSFDSLN